jgi:hypothetical protein
MLLMRTKGRNLVFPQLMDLKLHHGPRIEWIITPQRMESFQIPVITMISKHSSLQEMLKIV